MTALFHLGIYVNASNDHLRTADRGPDPSEPITEGRPWTRGQQMLAEARRLGQELPLVFATFQELTFWAVARDIAVRGKTTEYRFAHLRPLSGFYRHDLVVDSTGRSLPDYYIRSYVPIRTPNFLSPESSAEPPLVADEADWLAAEPSALEGQLQQRMVVHRRREGSLRAAKIREALQRGGGHLACEVQGCGFDFQRIYGKLGEGYAQVHHLRPLADYGEGEETRLADLAIVCANCHAMIHLGGGSRPLDELIPNGPAGGVRENTPKRTRRGGKGRPEASV